MGIFVIIAALCDALIAFVSDEMVHYFLTLKSCPKHCWKNYTHSFCKLICVRTKNNNDECQACIFGCAKIDKFKLRILSYDRCTAKNKRRSAQNAISHLPDLFKKRLRGLQILRRFKKKYLVILYWFPLKEPTNRLWAAMPKSYYSWAWVHCVSRKMIIYIFGKQIGIHSNFTTKFIYKTNNIFTKPRDRYRSLWEKLNSFRKPIADPIKTEIQSGNFCSWKCISWNHFSTVQSYTAQSKSNFSKAITLMIKETGQNPMGNFLLTALCFFLPFRAQFLI